MCSFPMFPFDVVCACVCACNYEVCMVDAVCRGPARTNTLGNSEKFPPFCSEFRLSKTGRRWTHIKRAACMQGWSFGVKFLKLPMREKTKSNISKIIFPKKVKLRSKINVSIEYSRLLRKRVHLLFVTSIKSIDAEVVEAFSSSSEEWLVEVVEHLQEEEFIDEYGTWWSSTRALSDVWRSVWPTKSSQTELLLFFNYHCGPVRRSTEELLDKSIL